MAVPVQRLLIPPTRTKWHDAIKCHHMKISKFLRIHETMRLRTQMKDSWKPTFPASGGRAVNEASKWKVMMVNLIPFPNRCNGLVEACGR